MTTAQNESHSNSSSLYAVARDEVSLQASLKAYRSILKEHEAIALLYSPRSCQLARVAADESAILLDHRNHPIDPSRVFEARVFSDKAELRWLKRGHDGRAAILSEIEKTVEGYTPVEALVDMQKLRQTYLLWGKGSVHPEGWAEGWSRLTLARIGPLPIPISGVSPHQQSVALVAEEYLQEDSYGNLSVVEERLLKLEIL